MRARRATAALLLGTLCALGAPGIAGCATPSQGDRMIEDRSSTGVPDVAAPDEALAFAEIVLPPGATVLATDRQDGLDTLHRLVIDAGPQGVDGLLAASGFTAALLPGTVFIPPVPGFPAPAGPDARHAQDRRPPSATRDVAIFRDVAVDASDPARVLVHVWAYAT